MKGGKIRGEWIYRVSSLGFAIMVLLYVLVCAVANQEWAWRLLKG